MLKDKPDFMFIRYPWLFRGHTRHLAEGGRCLLLRAKEALPVAALAKLTECELLSCCHGTGCELLNLFHHSLLHLSTCTAWASMRAEKTGQHHFHPTGRNVGQSVINWIFHSIGWCPVDMCTLFEVPCVFLSPLVIHFSLHHEVLPCKGIIQRCKVM